MCVKAILFNFYPYSSPNCFNNVFLHNAWTGPVVGTKGGNKVVATPPTVSKGRSPWDG